MFRLMTKRGKVLTPCDIADEGAARLLYRQYNAARAAAIWRNAQRQQAFSKAFNAARNAGKGYLFDGKKPTRERVPAEAILVGEVLR